MAPYFTDPDGNGLPYKAIEETAELVTAEGGRGIAVRTDHTVESEVERLFARVRAESVGATSWSTTFGAATR